MTDRPISEEDDASLFYPKAVAADAQPSIFGKVNSPTDDQLDRIWDHGLHHYVRRK